MSDTWPSFIILGAGKSGTTSLYAYCQEHPEVFMSAIKETNFFELEGQQTIFSEAEDPLKLKHYPQSINNIKDYTALFKNTANFKSKGEASPMYLYGKNAPANLKKYVPEIKLIAILRQPSERLFSRYTHLLRDGHEPTKSFEDVFDTNSIWWQRPDLVQEGFYYQHLSRYFRLFDSAQIKVFLYDDLKSDSKKVMRELYRFIGVDQNFKPSTNQSFNVSGKPKSKLVNQLIGTNSDLINWLKTSFPGVFKLLKNNPIVASKFDKMRHANLERISLDAKTRQRLDDIYKDDIQQLSQLLQRDLKHWIS